VTTSHSSSRTPPSHLPGRQPSRNGTDLPFDPFGGHFGTVCRCEINHGSFSLTPVKAQLSLARLTLQTAIEISLDCDGHCSEHRVGGKHTYEVALTLTRYRDSAGVWRPPAFPKGNPKTAEVDEDLVREVLERLRGKQHREEFMQPGQWLERVGGRFAWPP
jgi:hypothetical protein